MNYISIFRRRYVCDVFLQDLRKQRMLCIIFFLFFFLHSKRNLFGLCRFAKGEKQKIAKIYEIVGSGKEFECVPYCRSAEEGVAMATLACVQIADILYNRLN